MTDEIVLRSLEVLAIGPGSGFRSKPARLTQLQSLHTVQFPELPEPTDDMSGGLDTLFAHLVERRTDLIVAGSRGGAYVAQMLADRRWAKVLPPQPSILLLGASSTMECVATVLDSGAVVARDVAITFFHGKHDAIFPFSLVRAERSAAGSSLLPRWSTVRADSRHAAV